MTPSEQTVKARKEIERRLEDWCLAHGFRYRKVVSVGDATWINTQNAYGRPCLTLVDDQGRVRVRVIFKKMAVRVEQWAPQMIICRNQRYRGYEWERCGGGYYANLIWDPETGVPRGLGFISYYFLTNLIANQESYLVPDPAVLPPASPDAGEDPARNLPPGDREAPANGPL